VPVQNRAHREPANREAALAAIALVPSNAAVAATGAAGAHLSERRYFYSAIVGRTDWVLIDRRDRLVSYGLPTPLAAFERDLRNDDRWRVVFARGDVVLYRRAAGPAAQAAP
jgi:hypothetical protein